MYPFEDVIAGGLGVIAGRLDTEAYVDAIERALSGACLPRVELAAEAERRFGADAMSQRLTEIWHATLAGNTT